MDENETVTPPVEETVTPPAVEETVTPPAPDFEALRDEKVVPIARGILSDMAHDMASTNIKSSSDFKPLMMKILQRTLDADLNLVTENPYIFSMLLDQYSQFSTFIQTCETAPTQDERFAKIGSELMVLLAGANLPMGKNVKPEDQQAALAPFKAQLEEIFKRENLTWLEIKYILEGLFNGLKATQSIFEQNVQSSVDRMEAKLLEIENISDLTMGKLNWALMTDIAKIREEFEKGTQS